MKILVPLNNIKYLDKYHAAGADEYYLGFFDDDWLDKFGIYEDLNRMSGFGKYANRYSFNEVLEIIKKIKQYGSSVFITMNANVYRKETVEFICDRYLERLKHVGVDGVICSDINLAKAVISNGISAVASTMCSVYNSDIAKVYSESGFERVILPRDLMLEEISSICENFPDLEYEIFFMRNGCIFSDGYCLGMHRPECGATCAFLKRNPKSIKTSFKGFEKEHQIMLNDKIYNEWFHNEACGMCALYRIKQIGIGSLKIVGRADDCESVCKDIELTKKNLQIVNSCSSESEYLDKMLFPKDLKEKCLLGLSCYYPEIRF